MKTLFNLLLLSILIYGCGQSKTLKPLDKAKIDSDLSSQRLTIMLFTSAIEANTAEINLIKTNLEDSKKTGVYHTNVDNGKEVTYNEKYLASIEKELKSNQDSLSKAQSTLTKLIMDSIDVYSKYL